MTKRRMEGTRSARRQAALVALSAVAGGMLLAAGAAEPVFARIAVNHNESAGRDER